MNIELVERFDNLFCVQLHLPLRIAARLLLVLEKLDRGKNIIRNFGLRRRKDYRLRGRLLLLCGSCPSRRNDLLLDLYFSLRLGGVGVVIIVRL